MQYGNESMEFYIKYKIPNVTVHVPTGTMLFLESLFWYSSTVPFWRNKVWQKGERNFRKLNLTFAKEVDINFFTVRYRYRRVWYGKKTKKTYVRLLMIYTKDFFEFFKKIPYCWKLLEDTGGYRTGNAKFSYFPLNSFRFKVSLYPHLLNSSSFPSPPKSLSNRICTISEFAIVNFIRKFYFHFLPTSHKKFCLTVEKINRFVSLKMDSCVFSCGFFNFFLIFFLGNFWISKFNIAIYLLWN